MNKFTCNIVDPHEHTEHDLDEEYVTLGCLHPACESCVATLNEKDKEADHKEYSCKTCDHSAPIRGIIESTSVRIPQPPPQLLPIDSRPICQLCDLGNETTFCTTCIQWMCDKCTATHLRFKDCSNHVNVPRSEALEKKLYMQQYIPICNIKAHGPTQYSSYCLTHTTPICSYCLSLQHNKGCVVISDKLGENGKKRTTANIMKESYGDMTARISTHHVYYYSVIQQLKDRESQLDELSEDMRKTQALPGADQDFVVVSIPTSHSETRAISKKKKQEKLINANYLMSEILLQNAQELKADVKVIRSECWSLMNSAQGSRSMIDMLIKEGGDWDIMSSYSAVSKRIREISESQAAFRAKVDQIMKRV